MKLTLTNVTMVAVSVFVFALTVYGNFNHDHAVYTIIPMLGLSLLLLIFLVNKSLESSDRIASLSSHAVNDSFNAYIGYDEVIKKGLLIMEEARLSKQGIKSVYVYKAYPQGTEIEKMYFKKTKQLLENGEIGDYNRLDVYAPSFSEKMKYIWNHVACSDRAVVGLIKERDTDCWYSGYTFLIINREHVIIAFPEAKGGIPEGHSWGMYCRNKEAAGIMIELWQKIRQEAQAKGYYLPVKEYGQPISTPRLSKA